MILRWSDGGTSSQVWLRSKASNSEFIADRQWQDLEASENVVGSLQEGEAETCSTWGRGYKVCPLGVLFGLEMWFLDLITIGWVFEIAGIVVVGFGTGMGREAGVVSTNDWGACSGVEEDTGKWESMCGDGEVAHVPAGVSDKEEIIFENRTTVEVVSGQIEGWWSGFL